MRDHSTAERFLPSIPESLRDLGGRVETHQRAGVLEMARERGDREPGAADPAVGVVVEVVHQCPEAGLVAPLGRVATPQIRGKPGSRQEGLVLGLVHQVRLIL